MQTAEIEVPRARKEINLSEKDKARFWKKVDKSAGPDGCWIWTAAKDMCGYGSFGIGGRLFGAHRIAWVLAKGQIPHDGSAHGICVCHDCPSGDRPECCNPAHLFLGTHKENHADKERKGRGNQPCGDANGSRLHPERLARGEAAGNAKLTNAQVVEIRALYAAGGITYRQLAVQFGVTFPLIGFIIRRKAWKHV